MTVRDSRTQARARTPGAEDDPTSTTVRDRVLGPTQCGISDVATKRTKGGRKPNICRCMLGAVAEVAEGHKRLPRTSAQPAHSITSSALAELGAALPGSMPSRRAR